MAADVNAADVSDIVADFGIDVDSDEGTDGVSDEDSATNVSVVPVAPAQLSEGRYVCTLSPALLARAVSDLREPDSDQERWAAIDQLKAAFNEERYGSLQRTDDKFFLKFLRAKKFDQKKALHCLKCYHKAPLDYKEIFDKVNNPISLKPFMDKQLTSMIGKAKDGSAVTLYRWGLHEADADINEIMAYSVLSLLKLTEDEEVQICGFQSLEDLEDFDVGILLKASVWQLHRLYSIWFECIPLRYKAAHIIHEGRMFQALMSVCRWFLTRNILAKVKLHGRRYYRIADYVDVELLPPYLDGTGPPPVAGAEAWNELFVDVLRETPV